MDTNTITNVTEELIENEVTDNTVERLVNTGVSHNGSFGGVAAGMGIGAGAVAVGFGLYKLAGKLRKYWATRKDGDIVDGECTEIDEETTDEDDLK